MRRRFTLIAILTLMLNGLSVPTLTATHGNDPCVPVQPYTITGNATNYPTTAGFGDKPVVALPLALGGCYVGYAHGTVTVCRRSHCVEFPVADYCDCYWGSADQRVIDLSYSAWALLTDEPLSVGKIEVTVIYEGGHLEGESTHSESGDSLHPDLPDTAMR